MKKGDMVLALLLILGLAVSSFTVWYQKNNYRGTVAVVVSDGVVVKKIDLASVTEPFTFTVPYGEDDYNVVRVEPGRIRVVEASCPDQIDVMQGWISDPSRTIVCLPNRLVIYIEAETTEGQIDGIVS